MSGPTLSIVEGGLELLLAAIRAGDPANELDLRVRDLIRCVQALRPDSWQLVPREPTEAMLRAWYEADCPPGESPAGGFTRWATWDEARETRGTEIRACYAAMIGAAPQPGKADIAPSSARPGEEAGPTAEDYEKVLADHRVLVRELDVLLNGDGAAQQASLCDIVSQMRRERGRRDLAQTNQRLLERLNLAATLVGNVAYNMGQQPGDPEEIKDALKSVIAMIDAAIEEATAAASSVRPGWEER